MPARAVITATAPKLAELFGLPAVAALQPRYNVAPEQDVPVVRVANGTRELARLRWGLIPHFSGDPPREAHVNARSETVAEKRSFCAAFKARRCLVPFSGFYGWAGDAGRKQPYFFQPTGGGLFACAGIWDRWEGLDGVVETVSVLTMPSNALVMPTDPRMPVVVSGADFAAWLDPKEPNPKKLLASFKPYPAEQMECWPIGTRVNDPANDDAGLLDPIALPKPSRE
jgi:putative SOS response-associated peptidase YedK